jgi:hypothetical protein
MMRAMPKARKPAAPKPAKKTARPPAVVLARKPRHVRERAQADVAQADATLFADLTEGERADALRNVLEDERLREVAKVGRYRVVTVEPLVVKPPEPLAGRRLARVIIFDYAGDRCIDAAVDLDNGAVCHLGASNAQPFLSPEEEAAAIGAAMKDERVVKSLAPGEGATAVMHYWSRRKTDIAYKRRSAVVLFGQPGERPSLVVVVDVMDLMVIDVVPAEQW